MDSIMKKYTKQDYFMNVLDMLIYRGWLSKGMAQQVSTSVNFEEAYYEFPLDINMDIKKIKLLLHILDIDFDHTKLDTITGNESSLGSHLIIVYSPYCGTTKYANIDPSRYWIEVFPTELVTHPVYKHKWVGKHEIIKNKDDPIFNTGSLLDKNCFPTIYHTDPQVKYLNGRVGDIIRITTVDQSKYRRVVLG